MDVLIGVAWPYASGPRHLGHLAGAYLPADVAARYHRLAGDRVLLVSGSDQHGTPITVAAERAGLSPAALADREHERIAASFARAGISFDHYTRTATRRHHAITQDLFTRLHTNGFVTEATQPAAFCGREGRSLPDRYVEGTCPACGAADARGDQCDTCGRTLDPEELGAPRCRRCGGPATLRPLRQLFLRLDLLQPQVERYLDAHESGWRPFVGAEARGWLAAGLRPRAITRDLDWACPCPCPAGRTAGCTCGSTRSSATCRRRWSGPSCTATPTPGGAGGRATRPATATSSARTTSGSTPSGGRPSCSAPVGTSARPTRWWPTTT
jgi:methionyl-tRNA synthetase